MKTLTVVCPVYNEQRAIPLFYERIRKVFDSLADRYHTQLIFTNNASKDFSREIINGICDRDPEVSIITLSRNFGYQPSIECGLRCAPGDLMMVIDVDCEDPPEMIPDFLAHHELGFDVVYGERKDRPESWVIKLGRKAFYRFTRAVADERFYLDMAEFCLITTEVRDAILEDNNSFPFIRASIGRIGFSVKKLPYTRHRRVAGETHYNFTRMAIFAIAGVLSSSTFPLRMPAYVFPFWAAVMVVIGIVGIVTGGTRAILLLLLVGFVFCGFVLTSLSIYLARVYKNGLERPNFVINKKLTRLRNAGGPVEIQTIEHASS